jgi:hypothetical protein
MVPIIALRRNAKNSVFKFIYPAPHPESKMRSKIKKVSKRFSIVHIVFFFLYARVVYLEVTAIGSAKKINPDQ